MQIRSKSGDYFVQSLRVYGYNYVLFLPVIRSCKNYEHNVLTTFS